MVLRRAHMATFPDRADILRIALKSLESQVDEIHLMLNEYNETPTFLLDFKKVIPILHNEDLKDVGKFFPVPKPDDHVFLVDDDLLYHDRYCDWMIERTTEIGMEKSVFGLHGSIYKRINGYPTRKRKLYYYSKSLRRSVYVDELGTGTVFALGKNIAPLSYLETAQKFVDTRYAKWCFESKVSQVAIARPRKLIRTIRHKGPSIYRTFTVHNPPIILCEMDAFVGRPEFIGKYVTN